MRRILLFVTDLEIGGTPTVVRELAVRLREGGRVEVEVACLKGWGPVADQLRSAGVGVTAFGVRRVWELGRAVRRLRELVRERGFDTVFSFLVHANFVAARAAGGLAGARFLQSIQTVQRRPRWHWWIQGRAAGRAEKIVVPSTAIVRFASGRCGVAESRFVVIPNAVEPGDFPRVEVFKGPVVRAGYLGRLDWAKNPAMLLKALELTGSEDVELHFFGDGPARATLEGVARSGMDGRVKFHGVVGRPQDALRQMDVLWLPSWIEGFGLVVIEAMASGVPVVACAGGGVTDIVTDGENGLLAGDFASAPRTFAKSLGVLRDDVGLRGKLIEGGLRTVRERFSWGVVLPQYRAVLRL